MAKKTPRTSEPAPKEKASPRVKPAAKAKPVKAKPVKAKPVKAKPVKAKPVKAKAVKAKPAAKVTTAKTAKATARVEPTSDSKVIINGIAEVVRLGLAAMDPETRAALLGALVKVGSSLASSR